MAPSFKLIIASRHLQTLATIRAHPNILCLWSINVGRGSVEGYKYFLRVLFVAFAFTILNRFCINKRTLNKYRTSLSRLGTPIPCIYVVYKERAFILDCIGYFCIFRVFTVTHFWDGIEHDTQVRSPVNVSFQVIGQTLSVELLLQ